MENGEKARMKTKNLTMLTDTTHKNKNMRQQYAIVMLFALIIISFLTGYCSYSSTSRHITEDINRALALALEEQQSDMISQDTIHSFNNHLQITELRGKATLAVDTRSNHFQAYAHCSEAIIFSLSDQRPAVILWLLTGLWAIFVWYRRQHEGIRQSHIPALLFASDVSPTAMILNGTNLSDATPDANSFGGLSYLESECHFYGADGKLVRLTPMQHQLMEMFFQSPTHSLTKTEICDALWPKKTDANETLYTLISRLKPVVEHHSDLKIESDRSKAYRLIIKSRTR